MFSLPSKAQDSVVQTIHHRPTLFVPQNLKTNLTSHHLSFRKYRCHAVGCYMYVTHSHIYIHTYRCIVSTKKYFLMACIYNIPASSSRVKTTFTTMLLYKMKESNSPCVVTFDGFIWIGVWLASRESRKRISLRIILVQPLSFLKSDRETGFSVNKKGVVLPSNILVWQ